MVRRWMHAAALTRCDVDGCMWQPALDMPYLCHAYTTHPGSLDIRLAMDGTDWSTCMLTTFPHKADARGRSGSDGSAFGDAGLDAGSASMAIPKASPAMTHRRRCPRVINATKPERLQSTAI